MSSVQSGSSSVSCGSSQPCCDHQDPITQIKCGKTFSKRSNLTRHIKSVHKATAEMQNADSDVDVDDSQSMPAHDSDDDYLGEKSLSESRHTHCSSAPPTMAASLSGADDFPYPPPPPPPPPPMLPSAISPSAGSAQAISKGNANMDRVTMNATNNGMTVANAWLIDRSQAPRSYPAGWSLQTPNNTITSTPRTTSPLPEGTTPRSDPSLLESGQIQDSHSLDLSQTSISGLENAGQTQNPLVDNVSQTLSPLPQDFSQSIYASPQCTSQGTNRLSNPMATSMLQDFGQITNYMPQNLYQAANQGFGHMPSPVPQDLGQTMNLIPQSLSQAADQAFDHMSSPVPQDLGQTISLIPQSVSQAADQPFGHMASPVPQDLGQTMNLIPQSVSQAAYQVLSRSSTPMLQDFGQAMGSIPQNFDQIMNQLSNRSSTPVLQDFGQAMGSVPQGFDQTMNQLSSRCSTPVLQGFGQVVAPMPQSFDQIMNPLSSRGSTPVPQDSGQLMNQLTRTSNLMSPDFNQSPDFSQSPDCMSVDHILNDQTVIPQGFGQFMNFMPQEFGQTTTRTSNPTPQDFSHSIGYMPQSVEQSVNHPTEMGRTPSPIPQDFGQMASSILQNFAQTTNQLARTFSRTSTPVPHSVGQSSSCRSQRVGQVTSHPTSISQTSSPFPQDFGGHVLNSVPRHTGQVTPPTMHTSNRTWSPLPTYSSATQASPTLDFDTTPHSVPHGATQAIGSSSQPVNSFNALAAAQIMPDSSGDFAMQDSDVSPDEEVIQDTPSRSTFTTAVTGRKRKLSHSTASRALQAAASDDVPDYPVKISKKHPGQMRAIDWLKNETKIRFENFYTGLLAQWGVRPGYKGTCVLVPEGYRALEPLEIMDKITRDPECYAPSGDPRAFWTMGDHGTTVVRALAWFSEWLPRKGVDLDNFLGSGFAPKDASHTCHHDHCLIHITYEAAHVNARRDECIREARRLRAQNAADVPEHCSKHQPPCLMQVSD